MTVKAFLIINPRSGSSSEGLIRSISESIRQAGFEPELRLTQQRGDAESFARTITEEYEKPLIIAGGGDGTINEVINGGARSGMTLAVLPLGTANVLAAELGIRDMDDAFSRICRMRKGRLTLGEIENEAMKRFFVLMAGVGFDAEIVRRKAGPAGRVMKKAGFIIEGMRQLLFHDRRMITLSAAGSRFRCHSAVVCNGSHYGGNFVLAPDACICRPGLAAVCVSEAGILSYLGAAWELFVSRSGKSASLLRMQADTVTITGAQKPIQIDGDYFGMSPAAIRTVDSSIDIIL